MVMGQQKRPATYLRTDSIKPTGKTRQLIMNTAVDLDLLLNLVARPYRTKFIMGNLPAHGTAAGWYQVLEYGRTMVLRILQKSHS